MRQLLTNRHLALENYQFESIRALKNNHQLTEALSETAQDKKYPPFGFNYPRAVVALESHDRANSVDALLVEIMPKLYVNDPAYIFTGTDTSINLREQAQGKGALKPFEAEFLTLMRAFGSHSRIAVDYLLPSTLAKD